MQEEYSWGCVTIYLKHLIADIFQSIFLIFRILAIFFFPILPLIALRQSSFSNHFSHIFLFFFFLTLQLLFFQLFLSFFFLALHLFIIPYLTIIFSLTLLLSFLLFFSLSSFLSHLTVTLLTTLSLHFCLFFFSLFHILLLQFLQPFPSSSIPLCLLTKKKR